MAALGHLPPKPKPFLPSHHSLCPGWESKGGFIFAWSIFYSLSGGDLTPECQSFLGVAIVLYG